MNKKLKKTNKRNQKNIVAMAACDCTQACSCGWEEYSTLIRIYNSKYDPISAQTKSWS